MTFSTV